MSMQASVQAEPTVVDFEKTFWECAQDVADYTANPHKSFEVLMRVYRTAHPGSGKAELAEAECRLREILGFAG